MLPKTLKLLRKFSKIKQKEMAEILEISPAHLSEIESGKNTISLELLDRYANFFEVKVSQILLFSEHIEAEKPFAKKARVFVTNKILKVMEWKIQQDEKNEVFKDQS